MIILVRRRWVCYDNRLAPRKHRDSFANGRSEPALYLIAHDRLADFVRYRKTHPHGSRGRENQSDVGLAQALAPAVNVRKRAVLIQSVRLVKQLLAERSGGKVLAALVTAAFENSASALRFHSLTEAVDFALLTLFGLIRSLHDVSPKLCGFHRNSILTIIIH